MSMNAEICSGLILSIDSPFPISELRKLKLNSFNQFTVIVAIVMYFKLGACVAS